MVGNLDLCRHWRCRELVTTVPMNNAKNALRNLCVSGLGRHNRYFNVGAIRECLRNRGILVKSETLNRYLVDLVKDGKVYDAGKGWYSTLAQSLSIDRAPVNGVIARIEKAFPLLEFTCWSTEQVNPYMHHVLTKFVTFIYTNTDLMPAVFDEIATWKEYKTYFKPGTREAKKFRVEGPTIVIRRETSEAPRAEGHVAPLEKMLVDLAVEVETLPLMGEGEFHDMARRIATTGRIHMAVLVRYARRNHRGLDDVFGKNWSMIGTK